MNQQFTAPDDVIDEMERRRMVRSVVALEPDPPPEPPPKPRAARKKARKKTS